MAPPPPNANLPLQERFLALAQTLQFAWFVGHLTLILTTSRYTLSWLFMNYYSGMAQFSYRTSFAAAALTYGIVVYKTQRARAKTGTKVPNGALGLLADENVQYLAMALIWLFSPQYPLALLPYSVYSVFHVATYSRANLIPVFNPLLLPQMASLDPRLATLVAYLEIALWVRVLLSAILFQRRSWVLLGLYTIFIRARYAQSSHVQSAFAHVTARADHFVGAQGTPPQLKQAWDVIKNIGSKFHDITEVNKYLGAGPAKKTS
ncbi:hypothetical protein TrVFT333_010480 [Trichoderma virens FT-333]|nr:hypothetical protein TrVFT333_010480 [Trichoderma virens FT-333]